ncbi:MAG: DeoR/GlpR family DNA-binding transcription regulator [Pseudomonadota bacterium]
MTAVTPRQLEIVRLARERGHVDVLSLAGHFDVTPQTIRRDLNELCDTRVLNRVHGGAMYPSSVANFAQEARRQVAPEAKQRIGARAADRIESDRSVILNIGTTTEQVAQSLKNHTGLMVVTNSIAVAGILLDAPGVDVVLAGGVVRKTDGGIVGEATVDFIRQFRVDYAVIGCSAIDEDGTLLDFDFQEVQVSRAIIASARQTILVADGMKFERVAPVRIGHLSDIDVLITDRAPPEPVRRICDDNRTQIDVTGPDRDQELEADASNEPGGGKQAAGL